MTNSISLNQDSAGRRRPHRPRARTSRKFPKIYVLLLRLPIKIHNLPSSDVPVLFLVLKVLVLGHPLGRRARGPPHPGTSRPADYLNEGFRVHYFNKIQSLFIFCL